MSFLKKIFGDYSTKEVKRIEPLKNKVLALEEPYSKLSDAELQAMTPKLKERLANGETLDDILPEAFAVCREASWRVLGMKHFPVQVIGGIILHQGRIAEMKTGEGKTLMATLPAYLNALSGKGVHIVTVNDYLARRDSEWMGKLYRFLGLSVGLIVHELNDNQRRAAYAADITYGTNNEMGFDYLRDNMVMYKEMKVQRGHAFGIVDEVDSILIDEARTPLIISGQGDESSDLYRQANEFVKHLRMVKVAEQDTKMNAEDVVDGDYLVDEKARTAVLTKEGIRKAEEFFHIDNLMDLDNVTIQHHINIAIRAHGVMTRDIDYVVKDGEVLIVDEFTGRIMLGRRYSDGLHQAIEAKEGVKVASENKTLATITFQNYFRLYEKLSGMTGTALTESEEFQEIYKLDAVAVPTNKPMIRVDHPDAIYMSEQAKYNAIIEKIAECHEKGQPVLVGTVSVEKSEYLSSLLKRRKIKHEVLNAKYHEKEAEIVAQAGKFGAVTIATNMAGRGTDIMLGGNAEFLAKTEMRKMQFPEELIAESTGFAETDNEEILEARKTFAELEGKYKAQIKEEADKVREVGGLFILGTERHESRRIDNQLRGRSGRQGDPGESRFYLSIQDDMMRLYGGDRIQNMMATLDKNGEAQDTVIEMKFVSKALESAQRKMESQNFAIRKNVLQYDDVINKQREVIYKQRNQVLDGEELKPTIQKMIRNIISSDVALYCPAANSRDDWNLNAIVNTYDWLLDGEDISSKESAEIEELLISRALDLYEEKETYFNEIGEKLAEQGNIMPEPFMKMLERKILLENVDKHWIEHIDLMDDLKKGIGLRAYGQHDPVVAFREESFDMFEAMTDAISRDTVFTLLRSQISREKDVERKQQAKITTTSGDTDGSVKAQPVRKGKKPGPNDPCWCGSGKKYKKCHMHEDQAK